MVKEKTAYFHLWTTFFGLLFLGWMIGSGRFQGFYIEPDFHPGFGHLFWLTPILAYSLIFFSVSGLLLGVFKKTQKIGHSLAGLALLGLLLSDKIAYLHTHYLLVLMLLWSVILAYQPKMATVAKWMLPLTLLLSALRFGLDSLFAHTLSVSLQWQTPDMIASFGLLGYGLLWLSRPRSEAPQPYTWGWLGIPIFLFVFGLLQGPLWTPRTHYFTWQYASIPTDWEHHLKLLPSNGQSAILVNSARIFGPYTGRVASDPDIRKAYIAYVMKKAPTWWKLSIQDGTDDVFVRIGDRPSQRVEK